MKKLFSIVAVFSIVITVSGCAEQHHQRSGNSPDQQRSHADKAQGELSSEVSK